MVPRLPEGAPDEPPGGILTTDAANGWEKSDVPDDRRFWMLTAGRGEENQAAAWVAGGYCATSYREAGKIRAGAGLAEVRAVLDATYPNALCGGAKIRDRFKLPEDQLTACYVVKRCVR